MKSGLHFLFLFLLTTLCTSSALANSCKDSLLNLVRKRALTDQLDWRFYRLGLITPRGGLCGATCVINSLHAIGDYMGVDTSYFRNKPEYAMAELLQLIKAKHPDSDPRNGVHLAYFADILPSFAKRRLGVNLDVEVKRHSSAWLEDLRPKDFDLPNNALGIFGVEADEPHAVQLFGINTDKQVLGFIDPGDPRSIEVLRYHDARRAHSIRLENFLPKAPHTPDKGIVRSYITLTAPGAQPPSREQTHSVRVDKPTNKKPQERKGYIVQDGKKLLVTVSDSFDPRWAVVRLEGRSWVVRKSDILPVETSPIPRSENPLPSIQPRKGYVLRDGKKLLVEVGEDFRDRWTFVDRKGERWLVNKSDILPYEP